MICIKCGKPATKSYSPDINVEGVGMCNEHSEEIHMDLMICMMENGWDYFEKKYLKEKKDEKSN
jgi:hypothetical protein